MRKPGQAEVDQRKHSAEYY